MITPPERVTGSELKSQSASEPAVPDAREDDLLPPDLFRAAVEGDPAAVAALLSRLQPQVHRFCRARLGRSETTLGSADDVAQDVCVAALAALPSYRLGMMPFRAFVFRIARYKIADAFLAMAHNRCDPVEKVPESGSDEPSPEQVILEAERNSRLTDLLGVLGPRDVEILTLRIAAGLTVEETAEALGSTPGAVRAAQHRAIRRIRRELEERTARKAGGPAVSPTTAIPATGSSATSEAVADLGSGMEEVLPTNLPNEVLTPSPAAPAVTAPHARTVEDAHREYRSAIRSVTHTVSGLGNLGDITRHRSFTTDLGGRLNLDAGLAALRRATRGSDGG